MQPPEALNSKNLVVSSPVQSCLWKRRFCSNHIYRLCLPEATPWLGAATATCPVCQRHRPGTAELAAEASSLRRMYTYSLFKYQDMRHLGRNDEWLILRHDGENLGRVFFRRRTRTNRRAYAQQGFWSFDVRDNASCITLMDFACCPDPGVNRHGELQFRELTGRVHGRQVFRTPDGARAIMYVGQFTFIRALGDDVPEGWVLL